MFTNRARTDSNHLLQEQPAAYNDYTLDDMRHANEKSNRQPYFPEHDARVDGSPDRIFALNPVPQKRSTFEQRALKHFETEQRIKRHWYPVLLAAIALDMFLLIAVFYVIYGAEDYNADRTEYLWTTMLIIFVPLVPTLILLFWPFPKKWRDRRDEFSMRKSSPRWRNIVNILTAAVSFVFVLGYLLTSAIPKYNSAVWETAIDVSARLPVPAIGMVVAQVEGRPSQARFSETVANGTAVDLPGVVVSYSPEGDVQVWTEPPALRRERLDLELAGEVMSVDAIIANSSILQPNMSSPLQAIVVGEFLLQYDNTSTASSVNLAVPNESPSVILTAFDPRLSLEEVILCSIVQVSTVNAFATNNMMMSVNMISDRRSKMVRPANLDPRCHRAYELLATADPPIAQYDLRLTSSQTTTSRFADECRRVDSEDNGTVLAPGPECRGGFGLTYSSQFVTTQVSVPGKSQQEIWIDCGAIVGAVQFFAWFLFVFFQD